MKHILLYYVAAGLAAASVAQDLGYVDNFQVTEYGNGYITVSWDLVEGDPDYPLHKYSLVVDHDLTSEFKCPDSTCSKEIADLESCVQHVFDLTPVFYTPSGGDILGNVTTTSGYTTDEIPGAVSDIAVTVNTDEMITLVWDPPTENTRCAESYNVCYRLDGTPSTTCEETSTAAVNLMALSACALYHVTVTPVTPSNSLGSSVVYDLTTHDGVPGEPQDVTVGLITNDTIQLLWNNPIVNPLCLYRFVITIGEVNARYLMSAVGINGAGYDNEFTFTPLYPCTSYIIEISSANTAELTSDKVVRYASTEDGEPLPPTNVIVTPNGPDSIHVSWSDNENDRCAGNFEVCWNDGVHPIEQCQDVEGDGYNILNIYDLLPCSDYDVTVTVQSPNGTFISNATTNSTTTPDVRPGPVVDLKISSVLSHQLTIAYQMPETDPQCVKEIITRVIDEDQRSLQRKTKVDDELEETINGLDACTNYRVQVSTKSPSGLESVVQEVLDRTLDDVPSAPQELNPNEVTATSITLQWFQPATNPRCATEYSLSWSDSVSNDTTIISGVSTFKVVYTVEDLTPCTVYDFSLFAQSSAGVSPETTLTELTAC